MMRVTRCAVSRNLAIDTRPSRLRVLQGLEDKDAPPFRHNETRAIRIERSAGCLRAESKHCEGDKGRGGGHGVAYNEGVLWE